MTTHTHDGIDWPARLEHMRRTDALETDSYREVAERLVTPLPTGTATVVDLGSGAGGMSAALAGAMRGGTLVLVDAVPQLLDAAAELARSVAADGVRVQQVLADAAEQNLADLVPPADLVWASHVLHHLPDELRAARRLAGLLRPGGRLALGEGGLATRCLPWDLGVGEPGLEHRLEQARNTWFTAMRADIDGSVRLPMGWNLVLQHAGLSDVTSFAYSVHHPAPASMAVRDVVADRLGWFAEIGTDLLDADDLAALRRLLDRAGPDFVGARDDIYLLSTRCVYLGTVPRLTELCSRCGRAKDSDPMAALTWMSEQDGGRQQWLCPDCARVHVRAIESKLPAEYW